MGGFKGNRPVPTEPRYLVGDSELTIGLAGRGSRPLKHSDCNAQYEKQKSAAGRKFQALPQHDRGHISRQPAQDDAQLIRNDPWRISQNGQPHDRERQRQQRKDKGQNISAPTVPVWQESNPLPCRSGPEVSKHGDVNCCRNACAYASHQCECLRFGRRLP